MVTNLSYFMRCGKVSNGRVMRMPAGRPRVRTKDSKYQYDQQYLKTNISSICVTFNKRKPDDMILLDWLNGVSEKKVAYIKRLIREDMEKFI